MESLVESSGNPCNQDNGRDRHCHDWGGSGASAVEWPVVLSATVLSGILSLLVSIKGLPEVEKETANKN